MQHPRRSAEMSHRCVLLCTLPSAIFFSVSHMCLACSALCHTEALQPDIIVIDALAGGDDKRNKDHAQGTRDPLPPLPDGATGWCACRFCPSLIYSDDDLYCDFCWPVDCGCECWCLCVGHDEVVRVGLRVGLSF